MWKKVLLFLTHLCRRRRRLERTQKEHCPLLHPTPLPLAQSADCLGLELLKVVMPLPSQRLLRQKIVCGLLRSCLYGVHSFTMDAANTEARRDGASVTRCWSKKKPIFPKVANTVAT